jgi:hypothetical protein
MTSNKSLVVKLDRKGEHRDDVPVAIVRTPTSEGKFVFLPSSSRTIEKGDDFEVYRHEPSPRAELKLTTTNLATGKSLGTMSLPPKLTTSININHTYRFRNTSAAITTVSFNQLIAVAGIVATSAVTGNSLTSCCKLHSVKVWPASGGSVDLFWASAEGREVDAVADRSVPTGITVTGSVAFIPPTKALVSDWTSAVAAALAFVISTPIGSIIDVNISHRIANAFPNVAEVLIGATSGTVYYPHLDGVGGVFTPVGFENTV